MEIYKYIRVGDDGSQSIEYAPTKKHFIEQQKEDLEMGFSITQDSIIEISFNSNDTESLCRALNKGVWRWVKKI